VETRLFIFVRTIGRLGNDNLRATVRSHFILLFFVSLSLMCLFVYFPETSFSRSFVYACNVFFAYNMNYERIINYKSKINLYVSIILINRFILFKM